MIFDIVVLLILALELKNGYSSGFLKSALKTIGYVAGAIAGLYFALQYNKSAWVILAIIIGAGLGSLAGSLIAKALKITVIRGPLAWINSWAGAALQGAKVILLAFIVGTVLLWAPWPTGQNAVAESKVFLKLNTYAPTVLENLQDEIGKRFEKF